RTPRGRLQRRSRPRPPRSAGRPPRWSGACAARTPCAGAPRPGMNAEYLVLTRPSLLSASWTHSEAGTGCALLPRGAHKSRPSTTRHSSANGVVDEVGGIELVVHQVEAAPRVDPPLDQVEIGAGLPLHAPY